MADSNGAAIGKASKEFPCPTSYKRVFCEAPKPDPLWELSTAAYNSNVVREGNHVLLKFADGRYIWAHCLSKAKGKTPSLKINKRTYSTANLIGLPFGTVLEVGRKNSKLIALPPEEDVLPSATSLSSITDDGPDEDNDDDGGDEEADGEKEQGEDGKPTKPHQKGPDADNMGFVDSRDGGNRNIFDDNTSQALPQAEIRQMREKSTPGKEIVQALIQNSSTFSLKTSFSQQKYITKKQLKYQPRCRLIQPDAMSISEAFFARGDSRRILMLRHDTIAQILAYSNVCAGKSVLVYEQAMGILVGALAHRMAGYGRIMALYEGQQPAYLDNLGRFNLSFPETHSIKWIAAGEVFGQPRPLRKHQQDLVDYESNERSELHWPCYLQPHTQRHVEEDLSEKEVDEFMAKRCARFARKLTRHSMLEARNLFINFRYAEDEQEDEDNARQAKSDSERRGDNGNVEKNDTTSSSVVNQSNESASAAGSTTGTTTVTSSSSSNSTAAGEADEASATAKAAAAAASPVLCDSLIIATRHDPTRTLLGLLPQLAPSSPFVVYCEYMEPLAACFRHVQQQEGLAINLRLVDTWMREYQVLPGRTHPNMNLGQPGGYLFTGNKLCPILGAVPPSQQLEQMTPEQLKELRAKAGGRRPKSKRKKEESANPTETDAENKNAKNKRVKIIK